MSSGCRVQGAGCRVQGAGYRVQGAGFRVQGAGFRVQGSGFRVQGAGCRVQGSGCRVQGPESREGCTKHTKQARPRFPAPPNTQPPVLPSPEFRVQGTWCRVQGAGCRVQGAGFRVQGAGFRAQDAGCRVQGAGFRASPLRNIPSQRVPVIQRCQTRSLPLSQAPILPHPRHLLFHPCQKMPQTPPSPPSPPPHRRPPLEHPLGPTPPVQPQNLMQGEGLEPLRSEEGTPCTA